MTSSKPLASRIALVTGASRGIGSAAALALAKAGAHVVAVARTVGGLEELDDAIRAQGGTATLVPVDVKDYDGIDRLAAALRERYGKLDILVGNAGVLGTLSPLDHVTPMDWDSVIATNVTANWRLIRAFADLLKASSAGRVVFLTSGVASQGLAYWGPYAASKAALEVLARTFAAETVTTNVRVNVLGPGPVRTRMLATAMPGLDPATATPPDVVADKIVELCLPAMTETGKYYDLRAGKFLEFQRPA
ncbi:MAG TPA: SDR family NAD(P)-dependent oxidoreductase [Xanthobacteraceae bacterium]|nr:SDR family NAD(P)-dependent oxidoreductase [Xanthobacteraceae bacterium]